MRQSADLTGQGWSNPKTVTRPVADARLAISLFRDEWDSLAQGQATRPERLALIRCCLGSEAMGGGLAAFFDGLGNRSFLTILPTGGGKSLCYQLPALVRYQRRGLLTIVISPLQALRELLHSLSRDGRGMAGVRGSIDLKYRGRDSFDVKLQRSWPALRETAERRRALAQLALGVILEKIPPGTPPSGELLVPFTAEDILEAIRRDVILAAQVRDPLAALDRALMFLHEQRVITLQSGLAVFRQAMTVRVLPEAKGRRYGSGDFQPLAQHYGERVFQVHVMNEYARQGLERIGQSTSTRISTRSSTSWSRPSWVLASRTATGVSPSSPWATTIRTSISSAAPTWHSSVDSRPTTGPRPATWWRTTAPAPRSSPRPMP